MKKFWIWIFVPLLLVACHGKKDNKDNNQPTEISTLAFDGDSAFAFVKAQTDFGPRVPNSEAHQKCAEYLISTLGQYCDTVYVQSFVATAYDGKKLDSKNIIGSFSPEIKENRILLASHWDSRPMADHDAIEANRNKPIDGADDGASGVGVLLELARQLQKDRPQVGIDIIFFDVEDYGTPSSVNLPGDWWCLGSQYWAEHPHVDGYTARFGILLDMVGAPDAKFYHEYMSTYYAQDVVSKVWGTAYKLGYGSMFINQQANPITDDHYYVNKLAHIPMIDIIHQDNTTGTGFRSVWHTTNDNINNISAATLEKVGKVLREVIAEN
ncbi:MAG: M28 family peptidase [Bacteroidales bacterium]|nr:M28 family peptidase [Bacteroidales bacterium]